ncbi:MAG TPA: 50S ribosomal protein L10 [Candidatus Bathyarchaeia archaeon]|nr:50S ribosomal protein L10 [Candidatus Bathyarchaeia archaeon]
MSKAIYQHKPNFTNKKQLAELIKLIQAYKNVGITRVENIAARTIQRLRSDLRGDAVLKIAKNTLMRLALKEVAIKDKHISKLLDYINGSCAFILTNGNPFKVANYLEKNKIPTAAKEGQIAPKDITVKAKDTGFAPGPVIGELQSIGLKTRIEGGTIKIIEDGIVCRAGEKVSRTLANVLGRLGEEPFAAGLSVDAIYSVGNIIKHDDLIVDFDGILTNLIKAHKDAYALSLETAIPTKENITELIGKSQRNALTLAIETNFITPETAGNVLAKTQLEAMILAKLIAKNDPSLLPPEILSAAQAAGSAAPAKEAVKEAPKKEEEEEDDEDSGMGSLFG